MTELRKDPIDGTWVIVSGERRRRPMALRGLSPHPEPGSCPFCPGNEAETPKEVFAVRPASSVPDAPGWEIRVFPNKYPALLPGGDFVERTDGVYLSAAGVGVHEVIVETPLHGLHLADMEEDHLALLLQVYARRIRQLSEDPRVRYVLVFRNHGFLAGATKSHPHSQVLALPRVPEKVERELCGARRYFERHGRCVFCDVLEREGRDRTRVILENDGFVALAPYASRVPYEFAVYPRRHASRFEEIGEEETSLLAGIVRAVLGRVRDALGDPAFHYVLHTAPATGPVPSPDIERLEVSYHWHLEVLPRLTSLAGFEWGSGMYINVVPPEEAAEHLRGASVPEA